RVVPVTVLRVDPLRVVQVKTREHDGYDALQVTFGEKEARKLNSPDRGHFEKAGVRAGVRVLELRLDDVSGFEVGQEITVDTLAEGELVDVTAISKGKGFAGTMKRHGFKGQGAAHGAQAVHRRPGSIGGCSTPGRVFKGTRMSGRMGHDRVTTQNLVVHKVDAEKGVLLIKGAIPGRTGGLVMVRTAVKRGEK
ncbi:MAG: 50S ribosomal protein L3, partial [Mycobacterium sp.]|nr:50S ribosomal protein L3 [Mycobacterium sp.]